MENIDHAIKNQIAALLRVINVTRCFKEDNVPCQIEEGLFLGSFGAASNKDALKRKNITHILTVANSLAPAHPNDFVYKIVAVADREDTNLRQYFDECFNFIDEAKRQGGGGVLVHCFVGRSRSVTIVVAYLMKKLGMSLSRALEHVKSRRPKASPNPGFMAQLQDFEKSLQVQLNPSTLAPPKSSHYKRKIGDQASIIGGVIEFIKELHQVLQALESKKRRKSLSPSPTPSPRPLPLPILPADQNGNVMTSACCNSSVADVEAKLSGSNVTLKVISKRIPGQIVRIIHVLEKLCFQVLHLNISSMEDTVLYSFVVQIGLECEVSVEELAVEVQKSFFPEQLCINDM